MKRFVNNKRGLSTVIGAVFGVMILLMGFSFILWEATQYDAYMDSVNERTRLDWERENELIELVTVYMANDKLNISIQNEGAVTAHLIKLWITNSSGWHEDFSINYYINQGNTVADIGQDVDVELDFDATYDVKLVTERGSIVMGTYTRNAPEPAPPVNAFGVFSLDWFYFKYSSEMYPEPGPAGVISKSEDYVALYVKVTNNYDENVTIKSTSMIMFLVASYEPVFYIVENVTYHIWRTNWDFTTDQSHSGSYSTHASYGYSTLTSNDLETSDATNVTVSFWYRDDDLDDSDNVYLKFWNGSTYNNIFELGNTDPEDTWHYYTVTTSDPQYLISDFHIRFDASGISSYQENIWVDDVEIKKTAGEEVILLSDDFEDSNLPVITDYEDGDPITIVPQESQILIFAADASSDTDWAWDTSCPSLGGTEGAIVMTALVFTIGESLQIQAQSLPFQALVLS